VLGLGLRLGLDSVLVFSCCCSSCGSALYCCCSRPCCCSCCTVPACLDGYRPLLASGSCSLSPDITLTRIQVAIAEILVPDSLMSMWQASHFLSQSSNYCFMPTHCVSSHIMCASSILAIWSTVRCNSATLHTCCHSILSDWLLPSPSVLTDSEVLLSLFYFKFFSDCSLPAMKMTHVGSPGTSPARLQAPSASAIFRALWIGNLPIFHQIECSLSYWQSLLVCRLRDVVSRCIDHVPPPLFKNPLNCVLCLVQLLCQVSSNGVEMVKVAFWG